jgi:hypothetical protein
MAVAPRGISLSPRLRDALLVGLSATAVDLHDEAIRFAQLAYEIRDPQLPVFAKHWPGITLLREDLRFAQILAGMGMK